MWSQNSCKNEHFYDLNLLVKSKKCLVAPLLSDCQILLNLLHQLLLFSENILSCYLQFLYSQYLPISSCFICCFQLMHHLWSIFYFQTCCHFHFCDIYLQFDCVSSDLYFVNCNWIWQRKYSTCRSRDITTEVVSEVFSRIILLTLPIVLSLVTTKDNIDIHT